MKQFHYGMENIQVIFVFGNDSFKFYLTLKSLIEEQTRINEQAWKKSATLLAYYSVN